LNSVDPLLPLGDGHTPLAEDDSRGLKLSYITTRGELNGAEQENILRAIRGRRVPSAEALLSDHYLRELHRAMFGEVWAWAGMYRRTETNIGVEPPQISGAVHNLVNDARAWVESRSEPEDTVGVRFHHRLVSIHPFSNGNGRHSRLAADYLVRALGQDAFSWGARLELETSELRKRYLDGLRRADEGEFGDLVAFARS
jgi:Fic-DOC domain mobile mystery protein B